MLPLPRRALIVIDVQNEYIGGKLPIEFPDVRLSLERIGQAMDAAQAAGIPVIVVQTVAPAESPIFAEGTGGMELHERVLSRRRDYDVVKRLPSAFAGTGLGQWLKGRGLDTITVAGYMTHNCDFATILDAIHEGFSAEFLSDASGSVPYENRAGKASAEQLHQTFIVVLQSRFAAVMTTNEWIAAIKTGQVPPRDTIFGSNQQARQAGKNTQTIKKKSDSIVHPAREL